MVRTRSSGSASLMYTVMAEERLGNCEPLRKAAGMVLCKPERARSFPHGAARSVQPVQGCAVGLACLCHYATTSPLRHLPLGPVVVVVNFIWQSGPVTAVCLRVRDQTSLPVCSHTLIRLLVFSLLIQY